ncbi:MAG TPA: excinuclease ABC subunit UvrA [Nitrospira sp.]|nr:excinuclease ABC subunit UvrA [Nitrospira sp.]HMU29488.1 excinuclease ABC subunit UvrA [Nitrospira sp.]HNA45643.1 excinuclease ABC subunit UvrA [Nitrospira sp.]HNC82349.1 excinuclease ABC subunit UvrA [Nitrospira sp.]HND00672.1 excinuclease ABC subunit UvrA [Nitrospira sp.]
MASRTPPTRSTDELIIEGARQNNLKNISLRIPHNKVTAITGLSGSGKSSLAFDTLFAEGQWRYVESLSTYARMFLDKVNRPDVDRITNIRPAIAIEQKNPIRTARSTVGTATEVADLLRLLFAKIGKPVCPDCHQEARGYHPGSLAEELLAQFPDARAMILFPVNDLGPGHDRSLLDSLTKRGFTRLRCGDEILDLHDNITLPEHRESGLQVVLDRLVLRPDNRHRLIEAIEVAFQEADGVCQVDVIGHGLRTYSTHFRCQGCGRTFEPLRPLLFSFNHPLGACPECKGFGNILRYDRDLVIPDRSKSLAGGVIEPWSKPGSDWWQKQLLLAMKKLEVDLTAPFQELPSEVQQLIWEGSDQVEGVRQYFDYLETKRYKLHVRVLLSRYRSPATCPICQGSRLKPAARFVKLAGHDFIQLNDFTIQAATEWFQRLALPAFDAEIAKDILRQLQAKLNFLLRVGLNYLTLSRQTKTLSGGEAQRIALANQLGSRLVGTLYVLDEPTIGLHARDTDTLAGILRDLATEGNTVVVVEHDPLMIQAADHIVEMGPASGEQGGQVVCAAPRAPFIRDPKSLTARYLRGEERIPLPKTRRSGNGKVLSIAGAAEHNLKNLLVRIPLHMLVCITGVSGSGKSTLIEDTVYRAAARAFRIESLPMGRFQAIKGLEYLKGVRLIDQQPIGRTPRSNPITYLKAFDEIRQLFASERDALRQGLTPGHFSFNAAGGRCERCEGNGYEKLEMYFFEDIYATCEQCNGRRFKPEILAIKYRGKTIHDVLNLTVTEAQAFFSGSPKLTEKLYLLSSIGLGYLRLGQAANTLSGGEAQRLKIAAELKDPSAHNQLYILDEPTTGLHLDDIKKLLAVLHKLVDAGNTLIVVEHNLDVIKTADWIIDLGPEGGEAGGQIVAEGRPEQVAKVAQSHTGRFLAKVLESSAVRAT